MSFKNLREFITTLEKEGELKRITEPVKSELEITEIIDRVVKKGGPALLFEQVDNADIPVFVNGFGTRKRMLTALGNRNIRKITEEALALLDTHAAFTLFDKIKMLPKIKALGDMLPGKVSHAPCQEITMEHPSFSRFPILKCWPNDGGPYLTLPLVFTKDPDTGIQNCGMYRMQVYDDRITGMHWQIHKGGAEHFRKYVERNERMPVSVAVGCDPGVVFSSTVPLPQEVDEMIFAGLLRENPVPMVQSRTNEIMIPAEAEIVFEGYVDPEETRIEGPFGDHTGFYSLEDKYPVFHLEMVTHRKNPIYHATVVGRPPMEDCFMGEAIEQLFLPLIKRQIPEIVDIHMPFVGVFHNLLLVSIKKSYPGHARKVMHALWGMGQAASSKVIVVLENDIDLRDYSEVAWKVLNNIDPERDSELVLGPVDSLDHASRSPNFGSKIGIDATRKWKEEGFERPWPQEIVMLENVKKRIDDIWTRLGID